MDIISNIWFPTFSMPFINLDRIFLQLWFQCQMPKTILLLSSWSLNNTISKTYHVIVDPVDCRFICFINFVVSYIHSLQIKTCFNMVSISQAQEYILMAKWAIRWFNPPSNRPRVFCSCLLFSFTSLFESQWINL